MYAKTNLHLSQSQNVSVKGMGVMNCEMGVMNCEMLSLGLCDEDFNCRYFKVEPIPSGIKCFYDGVVVDYNEMVEICMGYFREHVKCFTLDKDDNNPKMDWEKIKENQRLRESFITNRL